MRETRYIKAAVAQANTGQTTIVGIPGWARHSIWYLTVTAAAGTTPLTDFKFQYVIPKITDAPAVATTTGGDGSNDEVQTITLTGGPTHGTFTISWTGVSTDISATTIALSATATAQEVQDAFRDSLVGTSYHTGSTTQVAVARTGAGSAASPYVHTLTFSGGAVDKTNVDAVTTDGARLHTYTTDTNLDFADWNGITQIAGTTAGVVTVHVGPNVTTDDTGAIYAVNSPLPEFIAAKILFDRTSTNETYTYSLYATFTE